MQGYWKHGNLVAPIPFMVISLAVQKLMLVQIETLIFSLMIIPPKSQIKYMQSVASMRELFANHRASN